MSEVADFWPGITFRTSSLWTLIFKSSLPQFRFLGPASQFSETAKFFSISQVPNWPITPERAGPLFTQSLIPRTPNQGTSDFFSSPETAVKRRMFRLVLLIAAIAGTSGQFGTCEIFAGNPPLCNGLFGGLIWVPPGLTQQNLSATLIGAGAQAVVVLPGDCARFSIMVICSQAFRACGVDGLPLPLCPQLCQFSNEECAGITAPFDCNARDPVFSPEPLWTEITNRTGSPQTCEVADEEEPEIICPFPFIENPVVDRCVMKCPPTGIDDKRTNDPMWIILRIFPPLAIIVELLLIPSFWARRNARVGYRYIVYWWICQLIASCSDLLGKWDTWENYICLDKWTVRDQSSTICGLSVIGTIFGRNASVFWIVVITYTILIRFKNWSRFRLFGAEGRFPMISDSLVYHVCTWVPPAIALIIAYSNHWINANGGPFTCYIITDAANGWASNILSLIPLTVGVAMSTVFMGIIMFHVIRNGIAVVKSQWRILYMCAVYSTSVLLVIIFAWTTFTQEDEIKKEATRYLTCVLFTGSEKLCSPFENPVDRGLQLTVITLSSAVPVAVGVAFIDRQAFEFWMNIFRHTVKVGSGTMDRTMSGGSVSGSGNSNL